MKNPVRWLLALLLVLTGFYFYRFDPVGVDMAKFYFQLTAVSILTVILGVLIFLGIVLFSPRIWGKLKKVTSKTSEGETVRSTGTQKVTAASGSLVNGGFSGGKFAILCTWVIFLVLIWIFNPKLWEHIATNNWGAFVFWNVLGLSLLWALPTQIGVVAYVLFAGLMLGETPTRAPTLVEDGDTGWVRDRHDPGKETRVFLAYPRKSEKQGPRVLIPTNQYRFDIGCKGKGKVRIFGIKNPVDCNPEPGNTDVGDNLLGNRKTLDIEVNSVEKDGKPIVVVASRWPK